MEEESIRLILFLGIYIIATFIEWMFPMRNMTESRISRWKINFGLIITDIAIQRFTLGAAAYTTAIYAQAHELGLMNLLSISTSLKAIICFLLLDFAIYLQHIASHRIHVFWRFHKVHHTDLDLDASSGLRFHPVEILASIIYKSILIAILGVDPWVVIAFEATLNASSILTHTNVRYPDWLDVKLRRIFITPNMHRVHHSVNQTELDSNFGAFLSVWDRICRTSYYFPPRNGHGKAELGLLDYRDQTSLGLWQLLIMPLLQFKKKN